MSSESSLTSEPEALLEAMPQHAAAERERELPRPRHAENELLQVRLGIASSLFTALRARHFDTAAHSLRVTLGCASWALSLDLSPEQRDIIEVAALLHDIGKIGVPDSVLLKPAALTRDEMAVMDQHRRTGVEILRASCASPAILDIVTWANAWYGGRAEQPRLATDIPLGARMLSIVDAFDAMTSDQVYRRAFSRERAFSELFHNAGTQFDPDLVKIFAALHECDQTKLHEEVARRWLQDLDTNHVHGFWRLNEATLPTGEATPELLFQQKLLDNMRDAVVFIDSSRRIIHWNSGAERMTGIAGASVFQHQFSPGLLGLRDDDGDVIEDANCPVTRAIESGEQRMARLILRGRNHKDVNVEAHLVPVVGSHGAIHGAALWMRDVSPQLSLEARCHSLHQMATKDPLTEVANRAEFNRVHEMFVAAHLERKLPCSLIICDLDHFKSVNDTYGHPAGDEVLKAFARLLKTSCRPGDLVARYGGEEFAILCADCTNAAAARRAEDIRRDWSRIPHPCLNSKSVTASFGVTEIQSGDNTSTMLARADRALYDAKEGGRNKVVQLGTGIGGEEELVASPKPKKAAPTKSSFLAEQYLITLVPIGVAIEKLRGFVADHQAEIVSINGSDVRLKIGQAGGLFSRRSGDRTVPFLVELHFREEKRGPSDKPMANSARTRIHAMVSPQRNRDRRRSDAQERARLLLASFRAYLMATEEDADPTPGLPRRGKTMLLPWLRKKQG